jgi:predicted GTPase
VSERRTARRVVILGAAGRDFHDFLTCFRDRRDARVVAFTAEQIPGIAGRTFPAALAGPRYPRGIPIVPEADLEALIARERVDEVVLSYSDLAHVDVMHKASRALAAGADFRLLAQRTTALRARRPVVAVCAVRTGCGKSQVARRLVALLRTAGRRVVVLRHPMPYGDLVRQRAQRFATLEDLDAAGCTIEEREEYEPHLREGTVVFAGVDSAAILRAAEREADVLVWDGGNNDVPFLVPDLHVVVVDPLRPGHETTYHPGEENLRLADVVVVNKVDAARPEDVQAVLRAVRALPRRPQVVLADSVVTADQEDLVRGRRALVVEDGPTVTHGGMPFGAGTVLARRLGARPVDPRPHAVGSLRATFARFPHLARVLPAMGYSPRQVAELARTIARTPCDVVVDGSPFDLARLVDVSRPIVNVTYELRERGRSTLAQALRRAGLLAPPARARRRARRPA